MKALDESRIKFVEIANEVQEALNSAFQYAGKNNPDAFVLFLAKGRWYGDPINKYLLDYMGDEYKDETRNSFYVHYMKNYYPTQLYDYKDDKSNCAYNMQIEMLIYAQLWESHPFLYRLASLAQVCSNMFYDWNLKVPDGGLYEYIRDEIITPLKNKGLILGSLIENSYNSNFRNALAHCLYTIDVEKQIIELSNRDAIKSGKTKYTFDEFQNKFVHAILLDNIFQQLLYKYRNAAAEQTLSLLPIQISENDSRTITITVTKHEASGRVRFSGNINEHGAICA